VRVMAQLTVRGPMAHEVGEALAPLRKAVRDVVRRGVESGRMRDDIAPRTLAHLVEHRQCGPLDEATTQRLSRAEGHRLVMLAVLGVVGLDWRTAGDLVATAPELALPPEQATGASSTPPTGEPA
jgi:hypothetical protein